MVDVTGVNCEVTVGRDIVEVDAATDGVEESLEIKTRINIKIHHAVLMLS